MEDNEDNKQVRMKYKESAREYKKTPVRPYESYGGQSGTGTGFFTNTSGLPCQYHSTNAPGSSSSTGCPYQSEKFDEALNVQKSKALSEIEEL